MALRHFPEPVEEIVMTPLLHDTPAEISQPEIKDWSAGECEPIPGKTMPNLTVVKRDYRRWRRNSRAARPGVRKPESARTACRWTRRISTTSSWSHGRKNDPSLTARRIRPSTEAHQAADAVLALAPETNGEIAYRGYQDLEKKTGMPLVDLAEGSRSARVSFKPTCRRSPDDLLNSPCWSGIITDGRPYSAFTTQIERLVPVAHSDGPPAPVSRS